MRTFLPFAIVILMSTVADVAAQTLPEPKAVTDPKQISSKPNAQVEPRSLTIDKLYMTRQIGRPTWSPDGKSIAFISNMSGRNNIWVVSGDGGFPTQLTVSDQRQPESHGPLMASGSPINRTTTATSSGTSFSSRPRPAKPSISRRRVKSQNSAPRGRPTGDISRMRSSQKRQQHTKSISMTRSCVR